MSRQSVVRSLVVALGLGFTALPARALETDQYLAWSVRLEDSQEAIDRYLNEQLELVLARVDRGSRRVSCPEIPVRFFRHLAPTLVYSRIRGMLKSDPAVDRFPGDDVGYVGYLRRSIYRRPAWPFVLPMSRVLRVGQVYLGADKLGGHLFGFGRRYYLRYRRLRERGIGEEEALQRVIEWGFQVERTVVGGLADGVFSPADLEANYRGLQLARSFCEGDRPLLERRNGRWRSTRPLEIGRWVTPYFDETFNPSFYVGYRWRRVREPLSPYCADYRRPAVIRRFAAYSREAPPSRSQAVLAERVARRGTGLFSHSVRALCAPTDLRFIADLGGSLETTITLHATPSAGRAKRRAGRPRSSRPRPSG